MPTPPHRRATSEPQRQRKLAADEERKLPVGNRVYRSLKLWQLLADLEESLGTPESTRAVYDRIMELRIATPQIVLNYALFLQVWNGMGWHGMRFEGMCASVCCGCELFCCLVQEKKVWQGHCMHRWDHFNTDQLA
jgi:hypothetical protein